MIWRLVVKWNYAPFRDTIDAIGSTIFLSRDQIQSVNTNKL